MAENGERPTVDGASGYLVFADRSVPGHKTRAWDVLAKSNGAPLGHIKWYGAWRAYCFFPADHCLFNTGCLRDIVEFINNAMASRRGADEHRASASDAAEPSPPGASGHE